MSLPHFIFAYILAVICMFLVIKKRVFFYTVYCSYPLYYSHSATSFWIRGFIIILWTTGPNTPFWSRSMKKSCIYWRTTNPSRITRSRECGACLPPSAHGKLSIKGNGVRDMGGIGWGWMCRGESTGYTAQPERNPSEGLPVTGVFGCAIRM